MVFGKTIWWQNLRFFAQEIAPNPVDPSGSSDSFKNRGPARYQGSNPLGNAARLPEMRVFVHLPLSPSSVPAPGRSPSTGCRSLPLRAKVTGTAEVAGDCSCGPAIILKNGEMAKKIFYIRRDMYLVMRNEPKQNPVRAGPTFSSRSKRALFFIN
jgi:hypothetical protein